MVSQEEEEDSEEEESDEEQIRTVKTNLEEKLIGLKWDNDQIIRGRNSLSVAEKFN